MFYLQEHKGYSAIQAASIVSANAIAGIAGTFFSGIISDRLFGGRRNPPALIFGLIYIAATALFVYSPPNLMLDTAIMVMFGISMGVLLAYLGGLMAVDLCHKDATGMATGVIGVAAYLGAAIQDVCSGQLIQAGKTLVAGKSVYDFSLVGQLWIGAAVLSCLLAALTWLKPTVRVAMSSTTQQQA